MAKGQTIGNAFLWLKADSKGLKKGLAKGEKLAKARMGAIVKWVKRGALAFVALGAAAAAAATAIGVKFAKIGMDVVESENLFEVSLGNMAEAARAWSKELSKTLGLDQFELRKNVATFNVMIKSMGLGEDAAFDMAKGLTQLSHDMASFFNLKPEEAFLKLQSGISGEIEPLKRLGIVLTQNVLLEDARAAGINKAWNEMTIAEQTTIRYNAILKRTTEAQGDLARTMESPANMLRVMQSRWAETSKILSVQFLPIVRDVLTALSEMVVKMQAWVAANKALIDNGVRVVQKGLADFIEFVRGTVMPYFMNEMVPLLKRVGREIRQELGETFDLAKGVGLVFAFLAKWIEKAAKASERFAESFPKAAQALRDFIDVSRMVTPGGATTELLKRWGEGLGGTQTQGAGGLSTQSASGPSININMNGVTIREEADVEKIARSLGRITERAMLGRGTRRV